MNRYKNLSENLYILSAFDAMQRGSDSAYRYEQDAYFFWFTNLEEKGWLVVIEPEATDKTLIAPLYNASEGVFDGYESEQEVLLKTGANHIVKYEESQKYLKELATRYKTVHTIGVHPRQEFYGFTVNSAQTRIRETLSGIFENVEDCRIELNKLRAVKSESELKHLRDATLLTVGSFRYLYTMLQQKKYEYELEAELTYAFRKAGAQGHAYEPIVASGKNALTLHYIKNNDKLPKNGLVLIDAGARVNGYCADVTRTYAIGTPTNRQKAVHAAVEKAHHAIIALLGPEKSVKEYHEEVDAIMIDALESLGLYKKPEDYRKYFPHAISHGLGIDVHDSLGNPTHFKPGMVLTLEPGIYIPEEEIGVRIEDDILITKTGIENLSGDLPTSL